MSIPEAHPTVTGLDGAKCPVTGASHGFQPPQEGDSRSACPALNTMANHGYIPRSGKQISAWEIAKGLKECYGLTLPFSIFLSYTTFILLRRFGRINLYEISKHNVVEHNASLVHRDTPPGEIYAPIEVDRELLDEFVKDARTEVEVDVDVNGEVLRQKQTLLTIGDVGRARVRRERQSPLGPIQAEIARGEVAIILGVWETKTKEATGARIDWIEKWLGEERLPEGWRPTRAVGLLETAKRAKGILAAATAIREAEKCKSD